MRIFKYQLPVREKADIVLPRGARIIRVEDVAGQFFLWAMVNDELQHPTEVRHIEFYKTGQEIRQPENLVFIGTCKIFIMMELCLYAFERVTYHE